MINLKEKPFYLDDEAVKWVFDTLAGMTQEEKIGQMFIDLAHGELEEDYIKKRVAETKCGGLRYMNLSPEEVWEQNRLYQTHSKIPLLIAANVEAGGNGACKGGTNVGTEIKIAATGDLRYAYELGRIGGEEAKALGCNWAFTPIVDLSLNWRNPIISTRTWSDDTDTVISFGKACMKGLKNAGLAATAKHFPGDGADERDHHYSASVNTLSVKEWDDTYGRIYKELIEDGVDAVMAGHIMLPEYQKQINPDTRPDEIMPASMCKELLTGLLREKLGFNGVIVTDATHMVGMSSRMPRSEGIAAAVMAGCDMILFFNDVKEDYAYVAQALKLGTLTKERVDEAVLRILALKASLGLPEKSSSFPQKEGLSVAGCEEHLAVAREVSDRAITLAKQIGEDIFPVTPEKYKRIMIMPVNTQTNEFAKFVGAMSGAKEIARVMKDKLDALGFEASIFISPLAAEGKETLKSAYDYKESIEKFKKTYDLVITIANVGSFNTTQRLSWDTPKGGFEVPWYVYDVPTIFVSFNCPFHLADVPQIKNYINCYDAQDSTVDFLIEKLTGASGFTGISPVDVFCGFTDTRI